MDFLKSHWDFILVAFGFGGVIALNQEHKRKTDKLELIIEEEIPKIREFMAKIDERTKHL